MGKNTGLNFSFVYAGYDGLVDIIAEKFARRETFLYYGCDAASLPLA